MPQSPIQWIFCDVDGCITSEASVAWNVSELLRLRDYVSETHRDSDLPKLTLCTGRPQPYVEALVKFLDIRLPAICESGAVVYTLMGNATRFASGVTSDDRDFIHQIGIQIQREILPQHPDMNFQFGKHAQISIFSAEPSRLEALRYDIVECLPEVGQRLEIKPSLNYLNLSLKGVSKGHTAAALAREAGLTRADLAAIGDTAGDLPLREAAVFFACPANAQTAVKQVADYVSPHQELEGVLDILTTIRRNR